MINLLKRSIAHTFKQLGDVSQISSYKLPYSFPMSTSTSTTMGKEKSIVWMDLEMTGLDVSRDKILELSCLITDKNLNIIAEGPSIEIYQPNEVLENMNEWCMKHHTESQLVDKCKSSNITLEKAEDMVLTFLESHIPRGKCPLAGNSVYMDRLFINQQMPKLDNYMHYRIIDVSTVKELCLRWNPNVAAGAPKKKLSHRSLDDIKESIEEMRYYKKFLFK